MGFQEDQYDVDRWAKIDAKNERPWWFWALVGCGFLFVSCICACIVSFGGLMWLGSLEPENVNIAFEGSRVMVLDREARLILYIENTGEETQLVSTVRVDLTLLEGFDFSDSEPMYTAYPLALGDALSYNYDMDIEAGETGVITFVVDPQQVGVYTGIIKVCMGAGFACESIDYQYEVQE